ncbi:MAG: nitroreductase family protein [Burkholderiales bacterium]
MSSPDTKRAADAVNRRFGESIEVSSSVPQLEALALLNERSVCRRYRDQPLPENLFRLLCATALSSPTKSDLQQADIVRVRNADKRAAINALFPSSPWIAGAPEFLVFCGDGRRLRRIFEQRGVAFANDHLDAFFNAVVDSAIVLSAFVQAAELAGLGSCPISEVRNHAARFCDLLELPDWVVPVAGLTLGYPVDKEFFSPRLALSATVHTDRYGSERVDAELADYDARRISDRPYRRQRDTARFGQAQTYGWTEDKFRQYADRRRGDFGAFVRGKRFNLD